MDLFTILAQATETTTREAAEEGIVSTILNFIWEQATSLRPVEVLIFICFGTVCLFYGWRVFKILATECFAVGGFLLGWWANKELIKGNGIWLGTMSAGFFAFMSIPLLRVGVMLLGAAAGAVLTSAGWYALQLPTQHIWAGAAIGAIAGGMISFIVFKIAVILFTSLLGSAMIVAGVLAVLYKYMGAAEGLQGRVFNDKWFLPLMLLVPMAVGIIFQNKFIKGAKDWTV
jgi:hypothetical protein